MGSYELILEKLEAFISRYYKRQLLQGTFLFLFFGGLLFLIIGALEYFLWFSPMGRLLLLCSGLLLEGFLLVRQVLTPVLRLFRLRKGLTHLEGSRLIGEHFPQVQDRLVNLLELAENPQKSELILAGIEQRSNQLKAVPFYQAVNLREPLRLVRYVLIPVGLAVLIWFSGRGIAFLSSYQRVIRYNVAFEPPAPFRFELWETDLEVLENRPVALKVKTPGNVQPDEVRLVINGSPFLMEDRLTYFEHILKPPLQDATFYFEANGFRSAEFELRVLKVPVIDRFEMELTYPEYLGQPRQVIKGTGNTTVPEGTLVRWNLRAINTDTINYSDADTLLLADRKGDEYAIQKRWFNSRDYVISTSNKKVREYDRLAYHIQVVRDEYPRIEASMQRDTLNPNLVYFGGTVSDDYGLSSLQLVCRSEDPADSVQTINLGRPAGNQETFYYTFPSGLQWEPGKRYLVHFQARDNDGVHGGKLAKTGDFRITLLDESEQEQERMNAQKGILENLKRGQKQRERNAADWDAFLKKQKEQKELGYSNRQELNGLVEKQKQQELLMEKFSKSLSENLEKETEKGPANDLLQERLERQELEARKNAALLEEMQQLMDKMDQEELQERLEELGKSRESNTRSLEQLLELTKRYYITQKARDLASRLKKLAERQEALSGLDDLKESFGDKEQQELNAAFNALQKELDQFDKDNKGLRKPLPWRRDSQKERSIETDQKEALDELKKQDGAGQTSTSESEKAAEAADQKQKAASRKLKEVAQGLEQDTAGASQSENAEDAEMLRQVLDNLVIFSLQQEDLFDAIRAQEEGSLYRSGDILRQQELRKLFEHVDDSLFALSLRRPEIAEHVNKQITEVYYNVDKGLESLSENQWYRGAAYQQYVITASNELASLLADILENMQSSLKPGNGQGGADFQLPDIIQSQQELQERMQGGKPGNEGKEPTPGEQQGQEGSKGDQGDKGEQEGMNGKDGKQTGKDGGTGDKGEGNEGASGDGQEMGYEELFEIYKEQQRIRAALEEQLNDLIDENDRQLAKRITQEMERFENDLLENGITRQTEQRLTQIREQLLRLKNAALQQGETQERQSRSNLDGFTAPILTRPESFENQGEDVEILNRQALPLRLLYKNKVKRYFNEDDRIPLRD